MKVGIVGAGAMGSIYGALMTDSGHEVWMFDKWQAHVDAMRTNGLTVEGAEIVLGTCDKRIVAQQGVQHPNNF